ncbi:DUF7281 domain-containing protein [Pseudomonas oryzae]|uniref:DUF7281 domain-containing protein n=1 Tax=Pseudomonas oryzae TaxID=1392877 RepID=A0A1H1MCY6_9PSED|nr:hypothetical protein [Pseudomonas oryzae]SDR84663.1 hypothetical protein SAMN05216221_0477 [Pseudomonas oryzae]
MAGLSRSHHNAVHRLLRERLERVEFNRTWQQLHAHFELGRPMGKWLHFDAETRRLLQRLARDAWGFDPLAGVPDGSRREVAAHAVDEKIARRRPDDDFVLVKGTLPAPLPALARGLSLRVALQRLDAAAIARVLLIENLDSFDDWEDYPAPPELAGSLVVYRGHRGLARGARQLLERLPAATPVVVFADYDPAGLAIAASLPRADALLLPELDEALRASGSREHFDRQFRQAAQLEEAELGGWQSIWGEMQRHRVSIKQQHMLALEARLRLAWRHQMAGNAPLLHTADIGS